MKKIVASIFICVTLILSMSSCRNADPDDTTSSANDFSETSELSITETEPFTYRVKYIRTGGYVDGKEYPYVVMVLSAEELADYISANQDIYNLGSWESESSDTPVGFLDAVSAYDEEFFSKNALLMVIVEEPSGSIRHEFTGFGEKNSILIERLVPEVCTTDMANWHILIEVPNTSPVLLSAYYPSVEWVDSEAAN